MLPLRPSLLSVRQRALSYRDADGISECLAGLALGLIGSQDFLQTLFAPLGTFGRIIPLVGFIVLLPPLLIVNNGIIEWLKERLVYPRTGYVAPLENEDQAAAFRKHAPYAVMVLAFFVAAIATQNRKSTVEGVQVGDKLLQIGALPTVNATWGAIFSAMHGKPGEIRTLLLERDTKQFTVQARVVVF